MLIRVNDSLFINIDSIVRIERSGYACITLQYRDGRREHFYERDADAIWQQVEMAAVTSVTIDPPMPQGPVQNGGYIVSYPHTPIHAPGENVKTILEPMPEPKGTP